MNIYIYIYIYIYTHTQGYTIKALTLLKLHITNSRKIRGVIAVGSCYA